MISMEDVKLDPLHWRTPRTSQLPTQRGGSDGLLGFLKKRHTASWQRSIYTTAGGRRPVIVGVIPTLDPSFPWAALQRHTDQYLRKKKRKSAEQREARLIQFIRASGDDMDVAIAACGHKLPRQTLQNLLAGDLNFGGDNYVSLETYLQAIVATNYVNASSVSNVEAQRAISLMAALTIGIDSTGDYLQALVNILIDGVQMTSLVYLHINILTKKACVKFALDLQELKAGGNLRRAYHASQWLSQVYKQRFRLSPENLSHEQLLDTFFPAWCSWATWKPDEKRLKRWEDGFTADERITLRNLLAFEGPDIGGRQKTLREGTIARALDLSVNPSAPVRIGMVHFEAKLAADAPSTLERLLQILDATCEAGSGETALLIHLLVEKTISLSSLLTLEEVRASGDSKMVSLLLQVCGTKGEPRSAQLAAAMHLLPLLSEPKSRMLREVLTPELVALISGGMEDMQTDLQSRIVSGIDTGDFDIKIQMFGQALLETWILPFLSQDLQKLLKAWPSNIDIYTLHWLRIAIGSEPVLRRRVNEYSISLLVKRGSVDMHTQNIVRSLMGVWRSVQADHDSDLRFVALSVAKDAEVDDRSLCPCLDNLPHLECSFLKSMRDVMVKQDKEAESACIDMARLLAPMSESAATEHFRLLLFRNVSQQAVRLVEYTLKNLKAADWIRFVTDLINACGRIDIQPNTPPVFLTATLRNWIPRLTKYITTLSNLERDLPKSSVTSVLRPLLLGGQQQNSYEEILQILTKSYHLPPRQAMLTVIAQLDPKGSNAEGLSKVMEYLASSTKRGLDACLRLVSLHSGKATQKAAKAFIASWIQPSNMDTIDQRMLKALAQVLEIDLDAHDEPSTESLLAAADYLDAQFSELFIEAQRLESLRFAYNKVDPKGISKLLSKIGIQDPSPIEDFLATLPRSLVGIVDMVEDDVVEMQFPLNLTAIQQIGWGVGNVRCLVLRLNMNHGKPPSFCMHLDNERKTTSRTKCHRPWNPAGARSIPDTPPCFGRANRMIYQLTRILSRELRTKSLSLEQIHKLITNAVKNLNKSCLVCGTSRGTQLRRSAPCQAGCSIVYRLAPLEVRLAEIRYDPAAMDLLLTMVHHAAASRKIMLLPDCAFANTLNIAQALEKVPALSTLTNVADLGMAVRKLGVQTEKLLSWTCLNYRGFLISARGKMRIPGMPAGTHQFLVANAAPELEAAFAAKIGTLPTRVLWHGTSMERLYAIMCEGLKICSGTSLQIHGAASGAGIYAAEEPITSWSYSLHPKPNWRGSSFNNVRVLLGLEAAGPVVGSGIHVVKDASTLIVRYVFLIPTSAVIPAAANVAPAMLSVYNSLRAGVL